MKHHVILTVEGDHVGEVIKAIAPLMVNISGLHIEQQFDAQRPRRERDPFELNRSKVAIAALRIMRGTPEQGWSVEEISLGMGAHNLSSTSASAACSQLTGAGYLQRRGQMLFLTDKGREAVV